MAFDMGTDPRTLRQIGGVVAALTINVASGQSAGVLALSSKDDSKPARAFQDLVWWPLKCCCTPSALVPAGHQTTGTKQNQKAVDSFHV
jgi:hypothetical protein